MHTDILIRLKEFSLRMGAKYHGFVLCGTLSGKRGRVVVVVSDKEQMVHFLVFSSTTHPAQVLSSTIHTTEDKVGRLVGDKQGVPQSLRPIRRSSGDTERTTGGAECPQLCLSTERAPWKLGSH